MNQDKGERLCMSKSWQELQRFCKKIGRCQNSWRVLWWICLGRRENSSITIESEKLINYPQTVTETDSINLSPHFTQKQPRIHSHTHLCCPHVYILQYPLWGREDAKNKRRTTIDNSTYPANNGHTDDGVEMKWFCLLLSLASSPSSVKTFKEGCHSRNFRDLLGKAQWFIAK